MKMDDEEDTYGLIELCYRDRDADSRLQKYRFLCLACAAVTASVLLPGYFYFFDKEATARRKKGSKRRRVERVDKVSLAFHSWYVDIIYSIMDIRLLRTQKGRTGQMARNEEKQDQEDSIAEGGKQQQQRGRRVCWTY